jgi:hypothetical protein
VLILKHFATGCFGTGLANNFCSGKIENILNYLYLGRDAYDRR